MNRRLTELLDWDFAARWRIIVLSILFAGGCGFFAERAGWGRIGAEIIVGICAASFLVVSAIRYVRRPRHLRKKSLAPRQPQLRRTLKQLSVICVALVIVVALSGQIRAAILNARLESVLAAKQPSSRAGQADEVLRLAKETHTRLRPELSSLATLEAASLSNPRVWSDYVKSLDRKVSDGFPVAHEPQQQTEFHLDGVIVVDLVLQHYNVVYDGGAVTLDHVCFHNVRFEIADTPNGRQLANAIQSSGDNCVSLALPDFSAMGFIRP
jgi:hypothetical protein